MAAGFCPFAVDRNIPPGVNDPAIVPRVAILHVDAGNADSLYDYFKNRSGGIESHFFVKANGNIEQYRSIYFQADANLDANDFAVSIETQGFGEGTWNDKQLASIKRLLLWLNTEANIPLRKIRHWDGSGVGYHTLFGSPSHWTPIAKSCPGPDRKVQFEEVLVPWMRDRSSTSRTVVATVNLNFGRPVEAQQRILDKVDADIVCTQEDVRGKHRERVIVRTRRNGTVLRVGSKLASLSTLGQKIRLRRFAWKDVAIPGVGVVRVVCAHMPPRRFPILWPIYSARLRTIVRNHPHSIVCADWNKRLGQDPAELVKHFGGAFYGERIDGIWVSPMLTGFVRDDWADKKEHKDGHVAAYVALGPEEN